MQKDLDQYLHHLAFPKLTTSQREGLDAPLTVEDLQEAVGLFPNCKASGEDGIPMEIYKQYSAVLLPRLLPLEGGALPPSMVKANIILLLKTRKDPLYPGSY